MTHSCSISAPVALNTYTSKDAYLLFPTATSKSGLGVWVPPPLLLPHVPQKHNFIAISIYTYT